jgi:hypothetical protein
MLTFLPLSLIHITSVDARPHKATLTVFDSRSKAKHHGTPKYCHGGVSVLADLFDQLISTAEQLTWNLEAKCLRGREIDEELKVGRLCRMEPGRSRRCTLRAKSGLTRCGKNRLLFGHVSRQLELEHSTFG